MKGIRLAASLVTAAASHADGQLISEAPVTHGQWTGPYDLADAMDVENQNPIVREITHALLIPPTSPGGPSPYAGRLMFITDRLNENNPPLDPPGSGPWKDNPQPTYVWSPDAPTTVERVDLPNDAATDTFCSGHASLGTGQPIVVGGLNRVMGGGSQSPPYAHAANFILRTDLAVDTGPSKLRWDEVPVAGVPRWYTTVCTLPSGDVYALGHTGAPTPDHSRRRDVLLVDSSDVLASNWIGAIPNRPADEPCSLIDVNAFVNMSHYPRTHVLTSGELMWADGRTHVSGHASRFLPVDLGIATDCDPTAGGISGTTYDDYLWRLGQQALRPDCAGGGPGTVETFRQVGGQTVHFVTYTGAGGATSNEPRDYQDTVYMIGGSVIGQDDKACPCEDYAEDLVKRWTFEIDVDLDTTGVNWQWPREDQCNPQLPEYAHYPTRLKDPRVNHNSVILLDGTILVVGGVDDDPAINTQTADDPCPAPNPAGFGCLHRKTPELYKPPEIFPGIAETKWKKMAEQAAKRQYHSVAGLLPDGRVFSAGGTFQIMAGGQVIESSQQSVELYQPTYFFKGRRPTLSSPGPSWPDPFATNVVVGSTIAVNIGVAGDQPPERFAILRPASVTHAFDQNQRYVALNAHTFFPLGDGEWEVQITLPPTHNILPPGWCLITGIDSFGRPSPAKWIFVQ